MVGFPVAFFVIVQGHRIAVDFATFVTFVFSGFVVFHVVDFEIFGGEEVFATLVANVLFGAVCSTVMIVQIGP